MNIKHLLIKLDYKRIASFFLKATPDIAARWYYLFFRKKGENIYHKIKKEYGEDAYIVLCPYPGTGDVYLAAAYMEEYAKKNKIEKYIFGVIGMSNYKVAELFGIHNIIKYSKKEMYQLTKFLVFMGIDESKVLIAHPSTPEMHYGVNDMLRNYNGLNFTEMYSWGVFQMEPEKIKKPQFQQKSEVVDQIISEHRLHKGKTVLIAPYSYTLEGIPDWFWIKLVMSLQNKGYDVCTNCGSPDEEAVQGTIPIFLPYKDLGVFLEYCGNFIGMRSGFCDVISSIPCKKIVIYQPNLYWGPAGNIDYFSLDSMGLDSEAIEIEYKGIDFLQLLKDIEKHF